uniref:RRM domain-containing protein n=1 Tax=Leersia perrieri TaxID=77586 RepID=A0A0D9XQW6_9ORYZ
MSDRQQSEELEEQVDLEGDDDVMDDDDGNDDVYPRRRRSRGGSDEPEEEEEDPDERQDGAAAAVAASGGGGDDVMDKDGGGDGPEDEEEKRKWDELLALPPQGAEVFIGGLPRDTTEEELRELCDSFGEIHEVRLMKDKETKENKGFAFVTYTAKDGAQHAIEELHDKEHKGRTLRCSLSQAKHRLFVGNVKTIYVKNLPENASKEKIKEIFEMHGEVTKVVLPPAKAGNKRDFGFVHFAERSSALKAVKASEKYEIDGQVLEVSMAKPLGDKKPDHSFKPGGAPNFPLPPYGGYMGDPYGAYGGAGGSPGFNQPMIYGRGPAPAGMRMVPMVLPDGNNLVEFLLHPHCAGVTGGTVAAEVVKGVMAGDITLTIM